jgi:hypothetical protein
MQPFADLTVQLLTDVADRIGGQPVVLAALEELAATTPRRRVTTEAANARR